MNITDLLFARSLAGGGGGSADRWSSYGRNPKLIKAYDLPKVYLKDTGYATWTPGPTLTKIADAQTIERLTTDAGANDYIVSLSMSIHYEYGSGGTTISRIENSQIITIANIVGAYGAAVSALEAGTPNSVNAVTSGSKQTSIYYNSIGNLAVHTGQTGVCSVASAVALPGVKYIELAVPEIKVQTSAQFSRENAAALDQTASYYKPTIYVYAVDRGTSINGKAVEDEREALLATQ